MRRLFRAGPELPPAVRSAVRGKPLAAADDAAGVWLVGTRDALHAVGAEGGTALSLRWERILRADWDADSDTLRVEEVAEFGRPVPSYSFVVAEPGLLLDLVRERVTASVVLQRRTELGRKRGFTVIGRRSPAGGGEVSWAVELDAGLDPEDPAVQAASDSALREARESLGLG